MAQELLDGPEILVRFEEMCGEGMAEHMGRDPARDPGISHGRLDGLPYVCEGLSCLPGRKEKIALILLLVQACELLLYGFLGCLCERHLSLLVPLSQDGDYTGDYI